LSNVGIGVIVTVGYDFFRPGEPNFGEKQLMGFVGSTMILLAGVSKLSNNKKDFWNFTIFPYQIIFPKKIATFCC
jgi:hypothetical protein